MHLKRWQMFSCILGLVLAVGCGPIDESTFPSDEPGQIQADLTVTQQRARCDAIKSTTSPKGISNPLVYAAVAYQETGLAHCWSEATWACQGPYSSSCGGPVIAGSGDGACSLQQGGLGMYQLDSGTYSQTIAQHGSRVLELDGNIDIGTNFIVYKVRYCPNTPNFNSDAEVLSWINSATYGSANYDTFMAAMAWCYNGCAPSSTGCSHTTIKQKYKDAATYLLNTFGSSYWSSPAGTPLSSEVQETLSSVPASMTAGATASVTVRVKNTGTTTWKKSTSHRLGAMASNSVSWVAFSSCGGYANSTTDARVELCNDVAPGATHDFTFSVRAPSSGSSATLAVQMVQDGVQWFGEQQSWNISVSGSTSVPAQVTGMSPDGYANMGSGSVTLSWNPSSGATSYEVYMQYWTGTQWVYYNTFNTTTASLTMTPTVRNSTYTYTVKAKNSAGQAPQSAWAYFQYQ